jgi:hypothetical protein
VIQQVRENHYQDSGSIFCSNKFTVIAIVRSLIPSGFWEMMCFLSTSEATAKQCKYVKLLRLPINMSVSLYQYYESAMENELHARSNDKNFYLNLFFIDFLGQYKLWLFRSSIQWIEGYVFVFSLHSIVANPLFKWGTLEQLHIKVSWRL